YKVTDGTATSGDVTVSITVGPLAGTDIEQYVRGVYQTLLGRDPEPAALAYWTAQLNGGLPAIAFTQSVERSTEASYRLVAQLDGGMSREALARTLQASDESLNGTIGFIYAIVLQRAVDPGGLAYWRDAIRFGDIRVLLEQLTASYEYALLVTKG